jgi:hypothetical protein
LGWDVITTMKRISRKTGVEQRLKNELKYGYYRSTLNTVRHGKDSKSDLI